MPKWWGHGPINKIERNNMSKENWNEQEAECYLKAVSHRIKEVFGASTRPKVSIYFYGDSWAAILIKPPKKSEMDSTHIRNVGELNDFIKRGVYRMQGGMG